MVDCRLGKKTKWLAKSKSDYIYNHIIEDGEKLILIQLTEISKVINMYCNLIINTQNEYKQLD